MKCPYDYPSASEKKHPSRILAESTGTQSGLILGLHPANERRLYFVMTSLIGWVQT